MYEAWKKESQGFTAKVCAELDPMDPREWDNLGTMVCSHSQYTLGDRMHDGRGMTFEEWIEEVLEGTEDAIWLPLYLFDHSGLSMSCGTERFRAVDSHGWDWGPVGIIYAERRDILEGYMVEEVTDEILQRAIECLQGEVETYDQYLQGDVYYYFIEDDDGMVLDSCGGYFGTEAAISEAEAVLGGHVEDKLKKDRQWVLEATGLAQFGGAA